MSKSYRSGQGRFVRQDNPVAVIGRLRDVKEREREAARARWEAQRRADAAKNGYRGPLTRRELAALLTEGDD